MSAAAALLLAFSLEVCGCDVAQDCEQIRALQISVGNWPNLRNRCAACLSSDEVAKVTQEENLLAASSSGGMPGLRRTVGQALAEPQPLTFYLPDAQPEGASTLSQAGELPSPDLPLFSVPRPRTWPIPESVFFVYAESQAGQMAAYAAPVAMAFVVSVPNPDHRSRIRFLVLARHVVDPEWVHCPIRNPGSIVLRLNRWSGGWAYVNIPLEADHKRLYFTPADGSSDIALLRLDDRILPGMESYKLMDTPYSLLPTERELDAIRRAGSNGPSSTRRPIVTASLNLQPYPEDHGVAVSYSGTLANTQAEPVDIQCSDASPPKSLRLWTIDAAVAREVSGAPVYTTMTRPGLAGETPVLIGVQSVAWPGARTAGITPAYVLSDLIRQVLGRNPRQMDLDEEAMP